MSSNLNSQPVERNNDSIPYNLTEIILKQLQNLRFGSIEIVVHDSKVVQIEKKEKTRFGN